MTGKMKNSEQQQLADIQFGLVVGSNPIWLLRFAKNAVQNYPYLICYCLVYISSTKTKNQQLINEIIKKKKKTVGFRANQEKNINIYTNIKNIVKVRSGNNYKH